MISQFLFKLCIILHFHDTQNSSVNFKLINFILWTKGCHQSPNFDTFKCSGENLSNSSCHFPNHNSVFLQILHQSSVPWKTTRLYFSSSKNITCSKGAHGSEHFWDFRVLRSKVVKLLMSIFKPQVDSFPNFVSLFSVMNITPLYFFTSNNIYFAQKEHIKVKIFETFKCLGQNLSNFPCQFWNDKSLPLQILHHSSLPWHITPLESLSSKFFYFGLKDPMKLPIFRLSSTLEKICNLPHLIFQTTSQFFFKFCITLQYHER